MVVSARKPRKLWKIGDLVRYTGLSRQTLHNYTVLGLICEEERTLSGGHRLYAAGVFARLDRIGRLKRKGKRLGEIAALLNRPRKKRRSSIRPDQGDRGEDS